MTKKSILKYEDLESFRKENKIQPFRINQIYNNIFKNSQLSFDEMTNISKDLREQLNNEFEITPLTIEEVKDEGDTTKILFKTHDDQTIETVIMYHYHTNENGKTKLNRLTLCVSSQIGCNIGCIFCVTGKLGLNRNLTYEEIISQLLHANNIIKDKLGKKEDGTWHRIRNVVFMGMGEPLLNYENVKNSIYTMLEDKYFNLSKRHITISTSGITPKIEKLIEDKIEVKLAISIHAPNQELRKKLVPVAKNYDLENLIKVLDRYIEATDNRIFYEYIMIRGFTDKIELASQLGKLLKHQLSHVNLIPYNENPAIDLHESDYETIRDFQEEIKKQGVTVTIRDTMGRKLKGACGQLGYEKLQQQE